MNEPIIYVYESQIREVHRSSPGGTSALGFALDSGDVFHVHTHTPTVAPSGYPCATHLRFVEEIPSLASDRGAILRAREEILTAREELRESPLLLIFFAVKESEVQARGFFLVGEDIRSEAKIAYIPDRAELYSRSKGLLELSVLDRKRVAVVGLGSGGSTIAVELAKAGVGEFVLIDFDRLELSNVARHVCGIGDLGRYKTNAVRDQLLGKNPHLNITTAELDINESLSETRSLLESVDLIIAATDNNRSRFNLNQLALESQTPAIFGRALVRATGGDVLRVRPFEGPCLACVFSNSMLEERQEEVSQFRQARDANPAYVSDAQVEATVQVGLSSDILPISTMMVKLALQELSRGTESGIASLEEDLIADYFIWANRREGTYKSWPLMQYDFKTPSVLRWYGVKADRKPACLVCGESLAVSEGENMFAPS